jgi:hypothetical protein
MFLDIEVSQFLVSLEALFITLSRNIKEHHAINIDIITSRYSCIPISETSMSWEMVSSTPEQGTTGDDNSPAGLLEWSHVFNFISRAPQNPAALSSVVIVCRYGVQCLPVLQRDVYLPNIAQTLATRVKI